MKNRPSLKSARHVEHAVSHGRLVLSAFLMAALVVGCGDGGADTSRPFGDTTGMIQPNAATDGSIVPAIPTGPVGTTGQVVSSAVDGGIQVVSNPAGGGLDTPWCKVKKI